MNSNSQELQRPLSLDFTITVLEWDEQALKTAQAGKITVPSLPEYTLSHQLLWPPAPQGRQDRVTGHEQLEQSEFNIHLKKIRNIFLAQLKKLQPLTNKGLLIQPEFIRATAAENIPVLCALLRDMLAELFAASGKDKIAIIAEKRHMKQWEEKYGVPCPELWHLQQELSEKNLSKEKIIDFAAEQRLATQRMVVWCSDSQRRELERLFPKGILPQMVICDRPNAPISQLIPKLVQRGLLHSKNLPLSVQAQFQRALKMEEPRHEKREKIFQILRPILTAAREEARWWQEFIAKKDIESVFEPLWEEQLFLSLMKLFIADLEVLKAQKESERSELLEKRSRQTLNTLGEQEETKLRFLQQDSGNIGNLVTLLQKICELPDAQERLEQLREIAAGLIVVRSNVPNSTHPYDQRTVLFGGFVRKKLTDYDLEWQGSENITINLELRNLLLWRLGSMFPPQTALDTEQFAGNTFDTTEFFDFLSNNSVPDPKEQAQHINTLVADMGKKWPKEEAVVQWWQEQVAIWDIPQIEQTLLVLAQFVERDERRNWEEDPLKPKLEAAVQYLFKLLTAALLRQNLGEMLGKDQFSSKGQSALLAQVAVLREVGQSMRSARLHLVQQIQENEKRGHDIKKKIGNVEKEIEQFERTHHLVRTNTSKKFETAVLNISEKKIYEQWESLYEQKNSLQEELRQIRNFLRILKQREKHPVVLWKQLIREKLISSDTFFAQLQEYCENDIALGARSHQHITSIAELLSPPSKFKKIAKTRLR